MLELGAAIACLSLAFGGLHLFDTAYPRIIHSTGVGLALGAAIIVAGLWKRRGLEPARASCAALFACLLLAVSDAPDRAHAFMNIRLGALLMVPFAAAIAIAFYRPPGPGKPIFPAALMLLLALLTSIAGFWGFQEASAGRLIFSDDHPAFLYRLSQLREEFPKIPFYNPQWNAGVDAREFFPSGALAPFLIFAPLIYAADPLSIYNSLVCILLFALVPASAFAAARLEGSNKAEASLAAALALSPSLLWYRWALAYGTLGFICSAALFPLAWTLIERAARGGSGRTWSETACAFALFSLMSFWTPSLLASIPLLAYCLIKARTFLSGRHGMALAAALLIFNLPWLGVFVSSSKVASFVQLDGQSEDSAHDASAGKGIGAKEERGLAKSVLRRLRISAEAANPIVIFFGLAALVQAGALKRAQAAWLLGLALLGPSVKPQLELERMALFLWLALCGPAARAIFRLPRGLAAMERGARAAACGLLFCAPVWLLKVASNQSPEKFHFASSLVEEMSAAIRRHGGDGRTMFAGFILHELDEGHVAPLPLMTGRPMIASRYQHDRWTYTDVIPEELRKLGEEGVERFLDLSNVSSVITHDRLWARWYARRKERYSLVWQRGRFKLFTRASPGGYFLEGSGEVLAQDGSSVRLRLDTPEALISFNHFPFLTASACRMGAREVAPGIDMIQLTDCPPGAEAVIESRGAIHRLLALFGHV